MLMVFLLLLIPVVVQAQHPTPTPSPAFVLAVRDGTADGPPVPGITITLSATRTMGEERLRLETDANGEIAVAEARHEVAVLGACDAGFCYYLPFNNLDTLALHIPLRESPMRIVLSRVDPTRLTFDYAPMPDAVEIEGGIVTSLTTTPMPAAVKIAARQPDEPGSFGRTVVVVIAVVLLFVPAAIGAGTWGLKIVRQKRSQEEQEREAPETQD
jgi:hypothetical protein